MSPTTSRTITLTLAATAAAAIALPALASGSALTGFTQPYAGTLRFEHLAPVQVGNPAQMNAPLGRAAADRLARAIGLDPAKVFTSRQYALFVSGKGVGGQKAPAKLVDQSVRILTNTNGRPLYSNVDGTLTPTVLASYGLIVNEEGMLESPANSSAPTRKVNSVLVPGGYMGTWARANGAAQSMVALYRSAYTSEVVFGARSQGISGAAQLVPNQKGDVTATVGMSMAPSIYLVNFALIYTLNPKLAAKMPMRWSPIPAEVATAISQSSTGQVPYSQYAALLGG
jgi:hypothetical protein